MFRVELLTVNLALLSPMSPTSGDMGHPTLWVEFTYGESGIVVSHVSNIGRHGAPDLHGRACFKGPEPPTKFMNSFQSGRK
jgi:hypothetical protein